MGVNMIYYDYILDKEIYIDLRNTGKNLKEKEKKEKKVKKN